MSAATSAYASEKSEYFNNLFMCGCPACHGKSPFSEIGSGVVLAAAHADSVISVGPTDETNGTIIPIGGSVTGYISPANDADLFAIDVVQGQTYLVSLRGVGSTPLPDPFLVLGNSSFQGVKADDDGGNAANSLLTFTAGYTGVYYIQASSFTSQQQAPQGGEYVIDVRQQGLDAVGNTNATAATITPGSVTFGFIESGSPTQNFSFPGYTATLGEVDRYKIDLVAGNYYTFAVAGGGTSIQTAGGFGELDTVMILRDAAGNVITANDDRSFPGDVASGLGFFAEQSGTYYIDVAAYAGGTGGYILEAQTVDLSQFDPRDSLDWFDADNVTFVDVNGVKTAYVYFGDSDENFNQAADGGPPGSMVTIDWNNYEKQQVMKALEEFEKILGVNYEITTNVNQATFRLLKTESEEYGAYFFPQDPVYGASRGVGVFNVLSGAWNADQQQSLEQGGFSFAVILHEFGHAHGLAHPHDNGGSSDIMLGVTGPTGSLGVYDLNQGVYTVMSYNDAWVTHPEGPNRFQFLSDVDSGWSGTLSAFDIATLQRRYGVTPAATGDDVYLLTDVVNDAFYRTIWDSAGVDEIAYGGALNAQIDLTAATLDYTPTGGGVVSFLRNAPGTPYAQQVKGGYTIANGVVIENASGGSGNDVLIGNAAVNKLSGNAGDDVLIGGAGADTLNGGAGFDTASYRNSTSGVTVTVANNGKVIGPGDGTGDTLISIEAVEGSTFGDTLNGGSNNDVLFGLAGNDNMSGANGIDKLDGGAGNDNIDGGNGNDQMFGRAGSDTILGGTGVDIIDGGGDGDILTGGSGADMFIFQSAAHIGKLPGLRDVVKDFQAGLDKIDLSNVFSGNSPVSVSFVANAAAAGSGAANTVYVYTEGSGPNAKTLIVGNSDGVAGLDFTLELTGKPALKASDFVSTTGQWNDFFAKHASPTDYSAFHDVMV